MYLRARSSWEIIWGSLIVRNFHLILKLEFKSAKDSLLLYKIHLYNNSKIENLGDNMLEKSEHKSVSSSSGETHKGLTIPSGSLGSMYTRTTLRGRLMWEAWWVEDTFSCRPTSSHGGGQAPWDKHWLISWGIRDMGSKESPWHLSWYLCPKTYISQK